MPKKYIVKLKPEQQQKLLDITKKGKAAAREIRRAQTLLMASEGKTDEAIAKTLQVSIATVERTRKQFVEENMAVALKERPRPGKPRKLSSVGEAFLIATACTGAPEGHKSWTLQLLAERLVSLEIVDSISADTVGRVLKKTNSSLGYRNNGVFHK